MLQNPLCNQTSMLVFLCFLIFESPCFVLDVNEESPPEPAPPEVPPRGPSLHAATLRRRTEYTLPPNDSKSNSQESQFMGQGGKWHFPFSK